MKVMHQGQGHMRHICGWSVFNAKAIFVLLLLLRPGRVTEYCDQFVCLSASISPELLDRSSQNFLCRCPVVVARSSSSAVAIRYVLPVLWMTSRLDGRNAITWRLYRAATAISGVAIPGRSLMSMNALLFVFVIQ